MSATDPTPRRCKALWAGSPNRCSAVPRGHSFCGRHEKGVADGRLATIDTPCATCGNGWAAHRGEDGLHSTTLGHHYLPTLQGPPEEIPIRSREQLHARIADVLRRSGVADADQLVRLMEQDAGEARLLAENLSSIGRAYVDVVKIAAPSLAEQTQGAAYMVERAKRFLLGSEIGPPK